MITVSIPRFFACLQPVLPSRRHSQILCMESPLDPLMNALALFRTRERVQAFINHAFDDPAAWTVGYVGYDVMRDWLRELEVRYRLDAIVIDLQAQTSVATLVAKLADVLAAVENLESDEEESLPVEARVHSL